jgi:hypothetical protein
MSRVSKVQPKFVEFIPDSLELGGGVIRRRRTFAAAAAALK